LTQSHPDWHTKFDMKVTLLKKNLNKIIRFNYQTTQCQMPKLKKIKLKAMKKKSESNQVNSLTLQSWVKEWKNSLESKLKNKNMKINSQSSKY